MDLKVAKPTWYLKEGSEMDFKMMGDSESTGEEENTEGMVMGAVKSWTSSCQSNEETFPQSSPSCSQAQASNSTAMLKYMVYESGSSMLSLLSGSRSATFWLARSRSRTPMGF